MRKGLVAVFMLVLGAASPASAATFTNASPISASSAPTLTNQATPYPSSIAVSGLTGAVAKVTVTIRQFHSTDGSYVDALLVGPTGARTVVFSDIYAYGGGPPHPNHVTMTFDDAATALAPASGPYGADEALVRFKPTNLQGAATDEWPGQVAAAEAVPASMAEFAGAEPNGTWSLYLSHEAFAIAPIQSVADGGWSLDVETAPPPPPSPDVKAPLLTRIATDDSAFRAAKRGGPVGALGVLIGFRIDEAARLSFDLDRLLAGRRLKGRCRPPKPGAKGRRCTRVRPVPGGFDFVATPGDNTFRFTGRLNGRSLKPGRYRLTGTAVDAAGNRSKPFSILFKVKKPAKPRKVTR